MVTLSHDMIHKEIEVYADDMITKSRIENEHIVNLHKLFKWLRKYKLRLNLMEACLWSFYGGWIFELQWGPLMVIFHHGDAAEDKGK